MKWLTILYPFIPARPSLIQMLLFLEQRFMTMYQTRCETLTKLVLVKRKNGGGKKVDDRDDIAKRKNKYPA